MMNRVFIILLINILPVIACSQNLLLNSGFEEYNNCTEYHMDCSVEAWFNIPAENVLVNGKESPNPVLGRNLLVVPVDQSRGGRTKIVYTLLGCPLQENKTYLLNFFLHTAGRPFYSFDIGFSAEEPVLESLDSQQIETMVTVTPADIISDYKMGWKVVQLSFTANGGERFMQLGNLTHTEGRYKPVQSTNKQGDICFFIDEMTLRTSYPSVLCPEFESNKQKVYAQNYRHTEQTRVLEMTKKPDAMISIRADTVMMPAVYFDVDKALIKPAGKRFLDSLSVSLRLKKIMLIQVTGHTDNTGTKEHNRNLSMQRAVSVRDYLVSDNIQPENGFQVEGKADDEPLADNSSAAGREKNRRVALIVSYLAPDK